MFNQPGSIAPTMISKELVTSSSTGNQFPPVLETDRKTESCPAWKGAISSTGKEFLPVLEINRVQALEAETTHT